MAVVDLAAAKAYLKITDTTFDAVLPGFIAAAEAVIAERCGPLEASARTERLRGGVEALALRTVPVISLTSVTPVDGSAVTLGDMYLDSASGVVTMNSGAGFPARYYTVLYSSGRSSCPADLVLAVKELLRHTWAAQRGGPRATAQPSELTGNTVPGAAYLLPFRVSELIAPHLQPGFA